MCEHGVLAPLGPGAAAIVAERDALVPVVLRRPKGDQHGRFAGGQARDVLVIDDAGAGLRAAEFAALAEGRLEFGPMDEILADGVQPGVPPSLAKDVILAIEPDRAIDIVDPAFVAVVPRLDRVAVPVSSGKMELRPQRFMVERLGGRSSSMGAAGRACGVWASAVRHATARHPSASNEMGVSGR